MNALLRIKILPERRIRFMKKDPNRTINLLLLVIALLTLLVTSGYFAIDTVFKIMDHLK